ncbi:hypothetical protein VHEMI07696 [[Torrubiella] hemipterigena]|uniref:Uncharacterized protein n=1 Tax=[Torrubiella] hemipterigena TaxID=1531966 RepID=A0A0A1T492_9HYPO|nr:hypothetical protein VHEMI07696 [[Torrubiella] hemipterigena]
MKKDILVAGAEPGHNQTTVTNSAGRIPAAVSVAEVNPNDSKVLPLIIKTDLRSTAPVAPPSTSLTPSLTPSGSASQSPSSTSPATATPTINNPAAPILPSSKPASSPTSSSPTSTSPTASTPVAESKAPPSATPSDLTSGKIQLQDGQKPGGDKPASLEVAKGTPSAVPPGSKPATSEPAPTQTEIVNPQLSSPVGANPTSITLDTSSIPVAKTSAPAPTTPTETPTPTSLSTSLTTSISSIPKPTSSLLIAGGPAPDPQPTPDTIFAVSGTSTAALHGPAGTSSANGASSAAADIDAGQQSSAPRTSVVVGASVGSVAAIALIAVLFWIFRRRHMKKIQSEPTTPTGFGPSAGRYRHEKQSSVDESRIHVPALDLPSRARGSYMGAPRSRSAERPGAGFNEARASMHNRSTSALTGSSVSENPFTDTYAVPKRSPGQPLKGIMKPPPPIPSIPPRSMARYTNNTDIPPVPSLTVPDEYAVTPKRLNLPRDKFHSNPFDLEDNIAARPLPPHRTSSIYPDEDMMGGGGGDSDYEDVIPLDLDKARVARDSPTLPVGGGWTGRVGSAV